MRVNRGVVAGLGVVVLWASAFPAIRVAAPAMGAAGLSVVRVGVGAAALVVVAVLAGARAPRVRDLGWVVAAGFSGMTVYQLLLNWGELHVPAGTASIVVSASPLVSVAVARLLFAERVTRVAAVGSGVALAGLVLVCLARAGLSTSGSLWVVAGAAVAQGVYHPLQRPLLQRYTHLEVACYAMVAGALMTLPFAPSGLDELRDAGAGAWWAAVYLGLLPSALGFVLWAYAVAQMPVAVSTSLLYLVPPTAILIAWAWLAETPLPTEVLGGLVVLAGVLVIARGSRRAPGPVPPPRRGPCPVPSGTARRDPVPTRHPLSATLRQEGP